MTNVVWTWGAAPHSLPFMSKPRVTSRRDPKDHETLEPRAPLRRLRDRITTWRVGRASEHRAVAEYRAAWRVVRRLRRDRGVALTSETHSGGETMDDTTS